jgi:hypothetical protein
MIKDFVNIHADLSLVVGIRSISNGKACKLNGLIERAAKVASREQKKLGRPSMTIAYEIATMYSALCKKTNWDKNPKHPLTFVNFCLEILENHNYPKIVEVLEDITEHFENGKNAPRPCFWAGTLAYNKWDTIRG